MGKSLTKGRNFTVVAVIALLFVSSFGFSSDKTYDLKDFNFGIHAGITYPPAQSIDYYILFPSDPAIGLSGGLSANYYFIKNLLAVQMEINYVMINIHEKIMVWDSGGNPAPPMEFNTTWNIIQVPLLVKLSSPLNFPIKPYITAGPAMALQVTRAIKFDGVAKSYNDILVRGSLIGGIGADYVLDNGSSINLEFRADWKMASTKKGYMSAVPYTFLTAFVGYSI